MAIRREIGQRLTATVPRILATISNEKIFAGTVVRLSLSRGARFVPLLNTYSFRADT
jgi:hypothetical protein